MTRHRRLLAVVVLTGSGLTGPGIPSVCAQPQGDETLKSILIPVPILFYTPETEFGFGAALSYIHRAPGSTIEDRPSFFNAALIFTTRSQVLAALGADHYWDGERHQITGGIDYRRFPDTFYGVGNDTPTEGQEYTDEGAGVSVNYLFRILPALRIGGGVRFGSSSITQTQPDDLLTGDTIPGSNGGTILGGGFRVNVDSRSNTSYPVRGGFYDLSWRVHGSFLGGDFEFNSLVVDLRQYLPLGGRNLIALRAVGSSSGGHVPFQLMPSLGGESVLRGYFGGRFRDRRSVAAQAELRLGTWRRLGGAAFASMGQVADTLEQISAERFHTAYGVGVRFLLIRQENLNLRFDWGFGEDQSGFYFGLGEAF
jgi:outer membrane protein assembly factor BamA